MVKNQLIKYKINLLKRIRYFYCKGTRTEIESLKYQIKSKIIKTLQGYKIALNVIKKKNPSLKNYIDYKKLDYDIMNQIIKKNLFLYPSYVFYPITASIILTYDCNYRCTHCYQKNYNKTILDYSSIELFATKIKKKGIKNVLIAGGEVFLYPRTLFRTIRLLKERDIYPYAIVTNGFWCKKSLLREEYLNKLKENGFSGFIILSLGIGHIKYNKTFNEFIKAKKLSEKIFGKNIFHISFEDTSYKNFSLNIKKCPELTNNFTINFKRIIPIGSGSFYEKKIFKENNKLFETHNNFYCLSLKILPDKTITFCDGPAIMNKEFHIEKLTKRLSLKKLFMSENKQLMVLCKYKGKELMNFLIKEGKINKKKYPFICQLCLYLSKNPKEVNKLYQTKKIKF